MKPQRRNLLSILDDSVRWTGIPARVAAQMSGDPSDFKHRPMRWIPMLPIAFCCALFALYLTWPPILDRISLGAMIPGFGGLFAALMGTVPSVHSGGPLGKHSLEDDEREAALRKSAFLFSLGLLALLNGLGQPILLIASHLEDWPVAQSVSVAASALLLNFTLFGCLPTLYASWKLRPLPTE